MSLVSHSHVALVRARRELENAFDQSRWDDLKALDRSLGDCLNQAFEDEGRDAVTLVHELERVLGLYASMVESLPNDAKKRVIKPVD